MWKFHNFSITQNLREFNFGDFTSAKSAILANLGALNFVFGKFQLSKNKNQISEHLNVLK